MDPIGIHHLTAITADQRLLKLAIKQLLDNALKYSAPGAPVTIAVRPLWSGMLPTVHLSAMRAER